MLQWAENKGATKVTPPTQAVRIPRAWGRDVATRRDATVVVVVVEVDDAVVVDGDRGGGNVEFGDGVAKALRVDCRCGWDSRDDKFFAKFVR